MMFGKIKCNTFYVLVIIILTLNKHYVSLHKDHLTVTFMKLIGMAKSGSNQKIEHG